MLLMPFIPDSSCLGLPTTFCRERATAQADLTHAHFRRRASIGAVNGAGNTLGSFSRAAGPATAGIVWGQMAQYQFPGHQFIPFGIVAVVACIAFCWLLYMRRRVSTAW